MMVEYSILDYGETEGGVAPVPDLRIHGVLLRVPYCHARDPAPLWAEYTGDRWCSLSGPHTFLVQW